jgi:hypothetical protein
LTCFDEQVSKIKNIISTYNPTATSIERHFSFPVYFEMIPGVGLAAHIKFKIRASKSTSLLKLIDYENPDLIRKPLQKWMGSEFTINTRLTKYNFSMSSDDKDPEFETVDGGAKQKFRGVTFYVTNIKSL